MTLEIVGFAELKRYFNCGLQSQVALCDLIDQVEVILENFVKVSMEQNLFNMGKYKFNKSSVKSTVSETFKWIEVHQTQKSWSCQLSESLI